MGTGVTPKYGLEFPFPGDPNNVPGDMQTVADQIDALFAAAIHGPTGARPAAGKSGRTWFDDTAGLLTYDTGTIWLPLAILNASGVLISNSAPGDTRAAGTTGLGADAGHTHGRENSVWTPQGDGFKIRTWSETLITLDPAGSTPVLYLAQGRAFRLKLSATNAVLSIDRTGVDLSAGQRWTVGLAIEQSSAGLNTITWPGEVSFGAAGPPVLSTAGNKLDLVGMWSDNEGGSWYAFFGSLGGY